MMVLLDWLGVCVFFFFQENRRSPKSIHWSKNFGIIQDDLVYCQGRYVVKEIRSVFNGSLLMESCITNGRKRPITAI